MPTARDLLIAQFIVNAAIKRGDAAAARRALRRLIELQRAAGRDTRQSVLELRRQVVAAHAQVLRRRRAARRRDAHTRFVTLTTAILERPTTARTWRARSDCSRRSCTAGRNGDDPPPRIVYRGAAR